MLAHSSNDLYGASKVLILVIEFLINNGYEIHLVLPFDGPLTNHNSVKKTKVSIMNLGVLRKKYYNFFGLLNRLFYITKSTFELFNYIKSNKIDLVYINTSTVISPALSSFILKTPCIFHIHEIPNKSKIYSKLIAKLIDFCSTEVITVSKSVKKFWHDKGIEPRKINLIYNGFDINSDSLKLNYYDKIIFTNISRIIPYKGHVFLINLFERISSIKENLILQIVGDTLPSYKIYFDELKEMILKKGLQKKIVFMGFRNDIDKVLKKTNFLIHTPIQPDPFPTVIFEAVKNKTPVICTDQGGAYEILNNGKHGLFIDSNSIELSAEMILKYIDDMKTQGEKVNSAYDYVNKNFNLNIFHFKLNKILSKY